MRELNPAEKALVEYRKAMTDLVTARSRLTVAEMQLEKATEDHRNAFRSFVDSQDESDRVREKLEKLIATPSEDEK